MHLSHSERAPILWYKLYGLTWWQLFILVSSATSSTSKNFNTYKKPFGCCEGCLFLVRPRLHWDTKTVRRLIQDALEKSFSNKAHPLPNNIVFGLKDHAKIMIMIKSRINLRHLIICHSTESISSYIPHQDVIKVQKFFSESYPIWGQKKKHMGL